MSGIEYVAVGWLRFQTKQTQLEYWYYTIRQFCLKAVNIEVCNLWFFFGKTLSQSSQTTVLH